MKAVVSLTALMLDRLEKIAIALENQRDDIDRIDSRDIPQPKPEPKKKAKSKKK